ncbi:MAG: response regulator [Syntrophobacteraceae bacterium]
MARLLIVDDDKDILFLMGEYLNACGFEFQLADSVAQARNLLKKTRYDVVLSDFNMPGESGLDLYRYVAAIYPDLPFILMTGTCDPRVKRESLSMGVYDYIEKPFQLKHLRHIINSSVGQARHGNAPAIGHACHADAPSVSAA